MSITCPKCAYKRLPVEVAPEGTCPNCGLIYAKYNAANDLQIRIRRALAGGDWSGLARAEIPAEYHGQAAASMPVTTTASIPGHEVAKVLDVISAECAFGMNLFKDFFTAITDTVGGRSGTTQKVLRDARRQVMTDLRAEAFALGADAVIGVDLDYSEFSGGGKSMLFVVATGTAVELD